MLFGKVCTKDRYKTVSVLLDDCLECLAEQLLRPHKPTTCRDDAEALVAALQDIHDAQLKKQQTARQGSKLGEACNKQEATKKIGTQKLVWSQSERVLSPLG